MLKRFLTWLISTAQLAHIGWGGFMVMACLGWGVPLWGAILFAGAIAAAKESAESIWGLWEPKQPWLSGFTDFLAFGIGIVIAVFVR